MLYIRVIFIAAMLLYVAYYLLLFGHLLKIWELTKEKIEFKKLLIPFYYLTKLTQDEK